MGHVDMAADDAARNEITDDDLGRCPVASVDGHRCDLVSGHGGQHSAEIYIAWAAT